jgi:HEAT repeat protein
LLLRKIGFEPGPVAALNLKRMESIAWLKPNAGRLDELDDAEQHSAVVLLMASGMRRLDGFATIERLVRQGQPGGRLAAAAALAQFNGAEANALALAALADVDPRVQAAIVPQLRPRGIPGSLQRLIDLLESPHELVRHAARASLAEFNLEKFLAAFDLLEDEARRSTGALVRKVNPEAGSVLSSEMLSPSRNRRLRAVQAAEAMGLAPEIETSIIGLLEDDDHVVRNAAARALGSCLSPVAHQALCDALADRSVIVQQTAEDSLLRLGHTVPPRPQPREDARS